MFLKIFLGVGRKSNERVRRQNINEELIISLMIFTGITSQCYTFATIGINTFLFG
jgi:hypothetical protein